jgi:hypothetical protein
VLFIVDAVGFAFAFGWTLAARRCWRLIDVAMLGGTAGAYVVYILKGWESADPVGLLTTTIELAAALIVLSPAPTVAGNRPGRDRWVAVAALPLALLTLLGTTAVAAAAQVPTATATGTAKTAALPTSPTSANATGTTKASGTQKSTGMRKATASTAASPAMAGMSPGTVTTALSLPTASPAGPIVWPDDMTAMASGMEMATPNCDAQPTAAQQRAAVTLVDQTVAAAAPYRSLAAAKAAGYVPVTPMGRKIVHYINPSIYRQGEPLDADAIPVLVYVNTTHGAVLSAAMYLLAKSGDTAHPPQPGGCLTQWHIHTDLCFSAGSVVGNDNAGSCATGSVNQVTQPMMHVWMTPVSGGPLAPDPPAVSEVEAANHVPSLSPPNATA